MKLPKLTRKQARTLLMNVLSAIPGAIMTESASAVGRRVKVKGRGKERLVTVRDLYYTIDSEEVLLRVEQDGPDSLEVSEYKFDSLAAFAQEYGVTFIQTLSRKIHIQEV